MINENVFQAHFRLMTPMELCLCMEDEELISGLLTLAPDERIRFMLELETELNRIYHLHKKFTGNS